MSQLHSRAHSPRRNRLVLRQFRVQLDNLLRSPVTSRPHNLQVDQVENLPATQHAFLLSNLLDSLQVNLPDTLQSSLLCKLLESLLGNLLASLLDSRQWRLRHLPDGPQGNHLHNPAVSLQGHLLQLIPQMSETRTSPQGNQVLLQQGSHQDSHQGSLRGSQVVSQASTPLGSPVHSQPVRLPSLPPRAVQLSREKRTNPQGSPQRNQVVCLLHNQQGSQQVNHQDSLRGSLLESPRHNHRRSPQDSLQESPQANLLHSLPVILLVSLRLRRAGSHL